MPLSRLPAIFIASLFAFTITFAAPPQKSTNAPVHIAIRADGHPGTGTAEDPFDGSTQAKFDAAMRRCGAGSDIVLGPGTFLTKGNDDGRATDGFFLQPNTRLRGSGRGVTVLKLAAMSFAECIHVVVSTGDYAPTGLGRAVSFDHVTVEDLTVDANAAGLKLAAPNTNNATYGVQISGNSATIRNVDVIGAYAQSGPFESFALGIMAMTQDIDGALIENCTVRESVGDYVTAIILGGTNSFKASGVIAHNLVVDTAWVAYSGGFTDRSIFADNVANRVGYGFRFDTGDFSNVVMTGNVWTARHSAILLTPQVPAAKVGDILIANNILHAEEGPAIALTSLQGTRVSGVFIRGNVLKSGKGLSPAPWIDPNVKALYSNVRTDEGANGPLPVGDGVKPSVPQPSPETKAPGN